MREAVRRKLPKNEEADVGGGGGRSPPPRGVQGGRSPPWWGELDEVQEGRSPWEF